MSQQLELPDTVYFALQELAEHEGTTPAQWIADKLPAIFRSETQKPVEISVDSSRSAWDVLDDLTGTVDAPEDWSTEHDHYITGSPKRQRVA